MKDTSFSDAQHLAERVRDTMFATDRCAHAMGMEVTAISPGHASVAMTVREDMLNGFGTCQGGLIATLADMAFAYACNSYNELTVASGFDVDLLGPGKPGDRLTATGRVVSQGSRMGVYDIEVSNQSGERIAVFRGRSYRMKGKQVVT
ncbi:hydroxyphenylacetyl-CoA thioesterase PaaI [Rhizobacter sp. AJA081-3]|jgi:acyl-CoA thioesterase|uniref:hydroxyphenylacetyl-CoA thioesterase PaaI n=1 Tax=Rhizobacter sp. AJA081-3 TaxID=2753607 RepID=UPI001AE04C68|nr:hydroxyphenylacetyl-CoA thioesterase PaaI [Rhizobacter sp. AJA081-3]QTN24896.1 hydroxyphenylacetyl-CoA thioesterase PaaI [Rhizobacter sp. AJA081-3]